MIAIEPSRAAVRALLRSLFVAGLALASSACEFQTLNSFSGDAERFTVEVFDTSDPGAVRFAEARRVLRQSCVSCHAAFGAYNEVDWLGFGYVVAGSAAESHLYRKIRGAGVGGDENMPPGITLRAGDLGAIRSWIDQMGAHEPAGEDPAPGSSAGPSPAATPNATARRQAALAVITQKCKSCHGAAAGAQKNPHGASPFAGIAVPYFADFTTDEEFEQLLVVTGQPAQSWLIRALKGHGQDIGCMPPSGNSAVTVEEKAKLDDWITKMRQP